VVVRDPHGNPVAGHRVDLVATGSENVIDPAGGLTDDQGRFVATWTSIRAESKVIQDAVDGVLAETRAVDFMPGPAAASAFVASRAAARRGSVPEMDVGVRRIRQSSG
jgi:hypothetical protein